MIDLREMPYVRIIADYLSVVDDITLQHALDKIDAMAYNEVLEVWHEYLMTHPNK